MTWTTEYPTQPGFYWIRNSQRDTTRELVVVEVDSDLNVRFAGCELLSPRAAALSAEWFGPIQPPEQDAVCSRCGRYNCQESEK